MTIRQFDRLPLLKRDPGYIGASLERLPDQLADGWAQAKNFRWPGRAGKITSVAICGMGGSHLAPDILRNVFSTQLRVPVTIVADYQLPAWVNRTTLVVCSSYSGNTEETLACLDEAKHRGALIAVVTSGGALARQARRRNIPLINFQPLFNPSQQPRLGLGYGLMATVAIWRAAGLLHLSTGSIQGLAKTAQAAVKRYGQHHPAEVNLAKRLTMNLAGKIPLLIGAEWTAGNLHAWTNQIHENAKTFAAWYQLPDLNHHLLEGLRNRAVTKQIHAVMIRDANYHPRNLRRLTLTKKILEDLGASVSIVTPRGTTPLEKSVDLLAFGGYVSWYLAAMRRVKPGPIPTVDALKKALGR